MRSKAIIHGHFGPQATRLRAVFFPFHHVGRGAIHGVYTRSLFKITFARPNRLTRIGKPSPIATPVSVVLARKKPRRPPPIASSPETRLAEVTTIGWMLSVFTALICQLVALGVWGVFQGRIDAEQALIFARYLHFSALVIGLISLALMAIALRVRRVPPPRSIIVFSTLVAGIPWIALLF